MTALAPDTDLRTRLRADPYDAYTYGYPHKSAYRTFEQPVDLAELWAGQDRQHLSGYLHLPFCEMRCGFCNLFTLANPGDGLTAAYLRALARQAAATAEFLGDAQIDRLALGGGTPTFLTVAELEQAFAALERAFGTRPDATPTVIETSPATATPDRLRYLREIGVERVSIGIQSTTEREVHRIGRPQAHRTAVGALDAIRADGPPLLNVDLMYGLAGQTEESWRRSLTDILAWRPEEIFCYPLYVRPLTGLGRTIDGWADHRIAQYRIAVEVLTDAGYRQSSLRRFYLPAVGTTDDEYAADPHGKVGLGCGARSYTSSLHYSSEFAVERTPVKRILRDWIATDDFTVATYGIELSADERMRRYVLQTLLHVDGLDPDACRAATGLDPVTELPVLARLVAAELAERTGDGRIRLTAEGLELSDAIGPLLYSPQVRRRSALAEQR
ncbi:STM4012 family radical SAM protein [Granulicoccus phenolivorans]|uniref:STM4012 family radical SAM protein n=1 Tax=Granulicoccus phenolivorans TaxID=266854 RepID=UPI0004183345|nr:STM4012 family radical SAM protein [Granulicoccus phenolivorans]